MLKQNSTCDLYRVNFTGNINLSCIQVNDLSQVTYLLTANWIKDSWASFFEDCGY